MANWFDLVSVSSVAFGMVCFQKDGKAAWFNLGHACISRLLPILLLVLPAGVHAQFTFSTNSGAITITGYTGTNYLVIIPDSTNGYPVTSIGSQAFFDATNVTSVTIPAGVTSIGSGAFELCTSLMSIAIPETVTNIGVSAFYDCAALASVTIPAGLTSIADQTFDDCSGLTRFMIPAGVTNIGNNAFQQCYGLSNVTIPDSVINIGAFAFFDCTNLASVAIPNGIVSIGNGAFQFCSGLTSVTIPGSVTSIGEYAFVASGLTAIMVAGENAFYRSVNGVLFNKDLTTLIQYPGGTTGGYTIPNGVTSIGGAAF